MKTLSNTNYACWPSNEQKYIQYMIGKAYEELGDRSMGCPIDLLKVLEDKNIYFTTDEIELDYAFVGLLCDELEKKVDWLDNRKITVKFDGDVIGFNSMKEWIESKGECEDEEGNVQQTSPTLENGYTFMELWNFLASYVPQSPSRWFKFATLDLTKNGINIGLQEVM